jgi:hypothetical protein
MVSARKVVVLVAALLVLAALACSTSVDLGGDEAPADTSVPAATAISEPVGVSLLDEDGEEHVPAGTAIVLTAGWSADTPELVADYLDALNLVVRLDGRTLANALGHYGPVEEYGDRDEDGDVDYVSYFRYQMGVLSPGVHEVESEFRLAHTVTDGLDRDMDGNLDEFSGSWSHQVSIVVGD